MPKNINDTISYPPRLMPFARAASYLSLTASAFNTLIECGELPCGITINGIVLWDRLDLDASVEEWKLHPELDPAPCRDQPSCWDDSLVNGSADDLSIEVGTPCPRPRINRAASKATKDRNAAHQAATAQRIRQQGTALAVSVGDVVLQVWKHPKKKDLATLGVVTKVAESYLSVDGRFYHLDGSTDDRPSIYGVDKQYRRLQVEIDTPIARKKYGLTPNAVPLTPRPRHANDPRMRDDRLRVHAKPR
jgi:hypothetical protein